MIKANAVAMNDMELEQVSGGMIWLGRPDGPGVINPGIEPIIPGMPMPWIPRMPNPFSGK